MRVLITGGRGYIGGRMAEFLAAHSDHEIVIGTRQRGDLSGLPRVRVAQVQWDSPTALETLCAGVDTIVHAAGMNASDCAADFVGAIEFNGLATARLLRAAITQKARRFIYLSTAHVYGSPLAGTITEETSPTSLHPYATSHRAGEDSVRTMHQRGDIEGIVVRLSNAFGAPASEEANCWMLLVNDLCRQAVATQRLVLNSSGQQRRDFVPVTDVCRTLTHLMELPPDRLRDGLFNVGGDWSPTVLEMAEHVAARIQATTGGRPEVVPKTGERSDNQPLDYRIDKLLGTGFEAVGRVGVDREIDALIRFCVEHAR